MACYLGISHGPRECAGCSREVPAGLIGFCDEIDPPRIEPLCLACLDGLDRPLARVQACASAFYLVQTAARGRAGLDP